MGRPFKVKHLTFLLLGLTVLLLVSFLYPINKTKHLQEWFFEQSPRFLSQPKITPHSNLEAVLAVMVEFETDVPVIATYTIYSGNETWAFKGTTFATHHRQPLIRFKVGKQHKISLSIEDEAGHSRKSTTLLNFQAPEIKFKKDYPELAISSLNPISNRGLVIVSLVLIENTQQPFSEPGVTINKEISLLLALDEQRDVVWFYKAGYLVTGLEQKEPNSLTLTSVKGRETIDFLGNRLNLWQGTRQKAFFGDQVNSVTVGSDSLHGKQVVLANGNYLILSTTMQVLGAYPASAENKQEPLQLKQRHKSPFSSTVSAKSMVVGDTVLEVSPAGEVIDSWDLFNILDTQRTTYHNHIPTEFPLYPPTPKMGLAKAWSRAKAIAYDQQNGTIIISLMHQDSVIGLDKTSGEIKWILGDSAGWVAPWAEKLLKPMGDFEWPYYPSSMSLTAHGNIMLLDNGGYRAIPPVAANPLTLAEPKAMKLAIDEQAMTVELISNYALPIEHYKNNYDNWAALQMLSIVDLPNENQLISADGLTGTLTTLDLTTNASEQILSFNPNLAKEKRWGISDFIVIDKLTAPVVPNLSKEPSQAPLTDSINQTHSQKFDPQFIAKANLSVPTYSIAGNWQLVLGEGNPAPKQALVLEQDELLVKGSLAGYPIHAFIKGNTFSMTVRRDNGEGRVRFRYFGVIDDSFDRIQGTVSVDQDGTSMAKLIWIAYKD